MEKRTTCYFRPLGTLSTHCVIGWTYPESSLALTFSFPFLFLSFSFPFLFLFHFARSSFQQANQNAGNKDTIITFNVASPSLAVYSALPAVTADGTVIDTAGAAITLDGTYASAGTNGLVINGADCIIRGHVQLCKETRLHPTLTGCPSFSPAEKEGATQNIP